MKKLIPTLLLCLVVGCTTTKYVEVPVEVIKTEYINLVYHDSVYVKDSVFIHSKKDTVYEYRYKYIYKYMNHTDTVIKTDTVTKTLPVIEEKVVYTNKLHGWQKILMSLGLLTLIYAGVKLYLKFKK